MPAGVGEHNLHVLEVPFDTGPFFFGPIAAAGASNQLLAFVARRNVKIWDINMIANVVSSAAETVSVLKVLAGQTLADAATAIATQRITDALALDAAGLIALTRPTITLDSGGRGRPLNNILTPGEGIALVFSGTPTNLAGLRGRIDYVEIPHGS